MNTNNRWMGVTIVLLVILNISALAFMWVKMGQKPKGPRPGLVANEQEKVSKIFKQELGLDDEQIEQFLKHRENHRSVSQEIQHEIQVLKEEMLNELFHDQVDTNTVARLTDEIAEKSKEMERLTFDHFAKLKKLCGEQQQELLQKLLDDFFRQQRLQSGPPPGEREPRGENLPRPPKGERPVHGDRPPPPHRQ